MLLKQNKTAFVKYDLKQNIMKIFNFEKAAILTVSSR